MARPLGTGVPALVVDGKYVVNMELGRKGTLEAVDDLVRELLADTVAEAPESSAS